MNLEIWRYDTMGKDSQYTKGNKKYKLNIFFYVPPHFVFWGFWGVGTVKGRCRNLNENLQNSLTLLKRHQHSYPLDKHITLSSLKHSDFVKFLTPLAYKLGLEDRTERQLWRAIGRHADKLKNPMHRDSARCPEEDIFNWDQHWILRALNSRSAKYINLGVIYMPSGFGIII